jgi:hypothetical protein
MTWTEMKNAVEKAGIKENDEITVIQCEPHNGAKTFHVIKLGKVVKLAEDFAESAKREASGCTC